MIAGVKKMPPVAADESHFHKPAVGAVSLKRTRLSTMGFVL